MRALLNPLCRNLFVVAAILGLITSTARANPVVIKKTRERTVWIRVPRADGKVNNGTGVLVDSPRKLIQTAYHVVDENPTAEVYFPLYADGKILKDPKDYLKKENQEKFTRKGRVVARNRTADLALIEVDTVPEGVTAIPLASQSPEEGERVYYVGCSGVIIDAALWRATEGFVRNVFKYQWKSGDGEGKVYDLHCHVIEVQSQTNGGDSGGPMVNEKGELVGIVHGGNLKQQGVKFSIDIREIRALIDTVATKPAVKVPDFVPPGPNFPVKPVVVAPSLLGTWKRTDDGIGFDTRHTWEFQASGRSLNIMDFGSGMPNRQEGTFRFADGTLTFTHMGTEQRYRVEFKGADRMQLNFEGNGYRTDWVREVPAAPAPLVPAPAKRPVLAPAQPAQPVKLSGAWHSKAENQDVIMYFMTNGRYIFFIHKNNAILGQQVEGTYEFANGLLTIDLPTGQTIVQRVEVLGPGRVAFSPLLKPEVKEILVKAVGPVTLQQPNGDTITLENK